MVETSLICSNNKMINSNIDVFCLSETWLKEGLDSNVLDIPGYRSENNVIKKGGGLCMYINKTIEFANSCQQELVSEA